MAVQDRYKKLSLEEKKKRRAARKSSISPQNSFYTQPQGERINVRIEGAVNRRAAGVYIRDF